MIRNVVKRLLAGVEKSKPTPIYPYIFHLYQCHDTMKLEDKKAYMIEKSFLKHNIKLDQDDNLAKAEDFERASLTPDEIAKLQAQSKSSPQWLKQTPQGERKAPMEKEHQEPAKTFREPTVVVQKPK